MNRYRWFFVVLFILMAVTYYLTKAWLGVLALLAGVALALIVHRYLDEL